MVILEFPQREVMFHRLALHLTGGNVHKLPELISLLLIEQRERDDTEISPVWRESSAEADSPAFGSSILNVSSSTFYLLCLSALHIHVPPELYNVSVM